MNLLKDDSLDLTYVNKELYFCFKFFYDTFSRKEESFGLVPDAYPNHYPDVASIAGTGYLFSALVVGSEYGFIDKNEAKKIVIKAMNTLYNLKNDHGWYYHFYCLSNGKEREYSEISTIDTALFIAGILTAGNYFGKDTLKQAKMFLNRIDFPYFYQEYKTMFSMSKEWDGRFSGHWDRYAEQLLLYVLGCANTDKNKKMDKELYYSFIRDYGEYKGYKYIYSWYGSLFTYQYSHGYIDFRDLKDKNGTNWFINSTNASLASYQYSIDRSNEFVGLHQYSWGQTACANVNGYSGHYGTPPTGEGNDYVDGTVAPCAAIGSIVFTPRESINCINYLYSKEKIISDYGLLDSYNKSIQFTCSYYISIDKGISLVMLSNYLGNTIWNSFMTIPEIQASLNELKIKRGK